MLQDGLPGWYYPDVEMWSWFSVIDFKNAYFHISIEPEHHCYLWFSLKGVIYKFKVLPFGLSTVSRVFMKCLAPVVAYLHLSGVMVFPYLDDWLLVVPSHAQLIKDISFTLFLLSALGLQMNQEKSTLHPTQRVSYIGAVLDASSGWAFLPEDRILKIQSMVASFVLGARLLALQVQRLLGLMASSMAVVQHARLKMRSL